MLLSTSLASGWWALVPKTFPRARGKPIQGARFWLLALRSEAHPFGLPAITLLGREADHEKVAIGNDIAKITLGDAKEAYGKGKGIATENPSRYFF